MRIAAPGICAGGAQQGAFLPRSLSGAPRNPTQVLGKWCRRLTLACGTRADSMEYLVKWNRILELPFRNLKVKVSGP